MTDRMRSIDDIVGKTFESMFSNRCVISLEQLAERTPGQDKRFDLDMTPGGSAFKSTVATHVEILIQKVLSKISGTNNRKNKEVERLEYILTEARSRVAARNPISISRVSRETIEKEMAKSFSEINRVLKPGGILSVTLEKNVLEPVDLLAPVFGSLISAGFQVLASWPIRDVGEEEKSEGDIVVIVALKKTKNAGAGCYDARMRKEMLQEARKTSSELGINGFDIRSRTIGSFGAAFCSFSRYDSVVTAAGHPQSVENAMLDIAEDLLLFAPRPGDPMQQTR